MRRKNRDLQLTLNVAVLLGICAFSGACSMIVEVVPVSKELT
jgi:hypothetical protein